jgi:hypothetical protein
MAIERYLYAADPYRATSRPDPLPYPIHTVPSEDQTILNYRQDILDILSTHRFSATPEIRIDDVFKASYPAGNTRVTTLRILFHTEQRTMGSFSSARDSLQQFLIRRGHHNVQVEVVHRNLCFQPSFFAIDPRNPAVAVYQKAKYELVELVKNSFGSTWRLISLFQVGQTDEKAVPTIVILVRPRTIHDWASLERAMIQIICSHCTDDIDINIEFLPGTLSNNTEALQESEQPGLSQVRTITAEGKMGKRFSIGLLGERGGGMEGL